MNVETLIRMFAVKNKMFHSGVDDLLQTKNINIVISGIMMRGKGEGVLMSLIIKIDEVVKLKKVLP